MDFVLPAVPKVVLVEKALVDAEFEIAQSDQIGIGRKADAAVMVNAIVLAMDVKQIQMLIAPFVGTH